MKKEIKEDIIYTQSFAATIRSKPLAPHMKVLMIKSVNWYQNQLNKFKDSEEVSLVIHNKKPKRTEQQNRYYWVYMTLIGKETGHTPEEIHEWAKGKFLILKKIKIYNDVVIITGSTTELSKNDFSELIMRIESETGIMTPPTEDWGLESLQKNTNFV